MKDRYPILLIIIFVLSRLFWYSQGVRFDDYADVDIIQMLPVECLNTNLWESLWYSHQTPPLYSIFMAMFRSMTAVHLVWLLLGGGASLALYYLAMRLSLARLLAVALSLAWMLLPSTLLFENIPTYDYPTACLLILSAWALSRGKMLTFAVMLMVVVMTRSLFHPVWMLGSMLIATRRM